jgi:glycogen(starch) synthase
VEVAGLLLLQALQRQGFSCAVVAASDQPNVAAAGEYAGIPVYRFPFLEALDSRDPRQMVQVRRQISLLLRRFQPDLVHAFYASFSSFFLTPALPGSVPVVLTLHDAYQDLTLQPDAALGSLLRRADWVAACSPAVLQRTVAQVQSIADHASAIINALPLPDLAPTPLPLDAPRLLCLGRVVPGKGFDIALRAFAMLRPRFPTARLTIAGDGPTLPSLRGLAHELDITPWVDFTGWVEPPEVPALLNTASLVLMPSTGFEPFGLVALQAAQMGRPIVASRSGGLEDVVRDSQTGFLVEPGDVTGLAEAAGSLLADPLLASRLGQAAYQHACTAFSWEQHVGEYVGIYERLLRTRSR